MEDNQLGRRNLTADQFKLLIGRKYNRLNNKHGGAGVNQHSEQKAHFGVSANTAELVAGQHGVSKNTVERAGAKVEAIDSHAVPELVD